MRFNTILALIVACHTGLCESALGSPASGNSSGHSGDSTSRPAIHAAFALVSLLEISEHRSEIVFSCFLKASWEAGRAPHGREQPFRPRLIASGARRIDSAGFLAPTTTVRRLGTRLHQVALVTVAQRCAFDLGQFPFDTQTCLIRISPAESGATLAVSDNTSDVQVEPDFDAFQHEFTVQVSRVPSPSPSALVVRLRLRRRLEPHLVRLFAPSALLVTASWLAALIPASLIRSRLPVTILALLSLLLACGTARQRGPGAGGSTAAHLWETGCLLFSLVSVLEAVLDMHLLVRAVTRGDAGSERTERRGAKLYFRLYALCWAAYCVAYWLAYVPRWRHSLEGEA